MTILAREPEAAAVPPVLATSRFDVTIAMPCLNEEDSIEHVIARAREGIAAARVNAEILVIDNGSHDRSVELARAAGARVVVEHRKGYGFACTRALREARGDLVLLGDADGTYDFAELPRFLELAWSGADVVMGSRLGGEITENAMPWAHRWIGVPALTWMLNVIGRARVGDAHCGLRMIRKGAADRLPLRTGGMEFASEMLIEARRAGLRFAELPIVLHPRFGGQPHLRSMRDGLRHVFLIASYLPPWVFAAVVMGLAAVGVAKPALSGLAVGAIAIGAATRAVPALSLRHDVPLRARVAGLVRAHPVITALVAAGVALRGLVVAAYGPMYFYGDSYTYLEIAEALRTDPARPPMYPLFLRVFSFVGDTGAVLVQHALGVAMGIAIYALLRRLGASGLVAALGAAPMLLDAYQIHIEHVLLTETLFQALILAAVCVVLRFDGRPRVGATVLAGSMLGMAILTRSVGVVVPVVVLALLLARRAGAGRIAAFAIALAIPLAGYATAYKVQRDTFAIGGYTGMFLYGRVGEFADCDVMDISRSLRRLCIETPRPARGGTNYYVWNDESPVRANLPRRGRERFARSFALAAIRAQPADYVRTVTGDLAHYLAPGRWTDPRDHPITTWRFQPSSEDVTFAMTLGQEIEVDARTTRVSEPLAGILSRYQSVAYTTGPLVGFALVLGVAGAVVRGRRRVEALFLAMGAALLIAFPVATAIFDYRYLLPALPLLGIAGALGWTSIAVRVRGS